MTQTQSKLSVAQLRQAVGRLPRYPLAHVPTALEYLPRFTRAVGGPRIHIKRDDCTGLAMGGNKTRHNEFLLGDAIQKGADLFVWGAGVQSNNCRQTAAACAKAGIECHLILGRGKPADGPDEVQGNLLLDHLVGASYEIVEEPLGAALDRRIDEAAQRFRALGRKVYSWDRDKSKPLAAVGYFLCMCEIVEQAAAAEFRPDAVYVCSSGSTGSGLALAAAALGCEFPIVSICPIRWEWDTQADMARIANEAAELVGIGTRLGREEVQLTFDYIAPGYGQPSPAGLEAISLLARTEGILLDPTYSGKALAGLIDHARRGRFRERQNVVFVHTGGTPALFACANELVAGIKMRTPIQH
jgi:D-cysteine desulfhydrase family pyridoxal phosphate-dependent enzyme